MSGTSGAPTCTFNYHVMLTRLSTDKSRVAFWRRFSQWQLREISARFSSSPPRGFSSPNPWCTPPPTGYVTAVEQQNNNNNRNANDNDNGIITMRNVNRRGRHVSPKHSHAPSPTGTSSTAALTNLTRV